MRKILVMVLFSMSLFWASGCSNTDNNAEKLSKLKNPVVVVSMGGSSHRGFWTTDYVVFRDSMGKVITLTGDEFNSLRPGDTLGVIKPRY